MPNQKAYQKFLSQLGFKKGDVPPLLPENDMAYGLALLKKSLKQIDENQRKGFEEAIQAVSQNTTNILMQNMSRDILQRISEMRLPNQVKTYTGVYPTNSFNAQATKLDEGVLILIDTGCFTLLEALTLLWAWDGNQERKTTLACQFIKNYVSDYALPEQWEYDHPSLHDGIRLMAFSSVLTEAEKFIIAHEHAHVTLGHIWQAPIRSFSTPYGDLSFVGKSKEQELDADRLAITLMMSPKDNDIRRRQIGAAPYIVFGVALLIEKAIETIKGGRYLNNDSHPPALLRGALLEKQLKDSGYGNYLDLGQKFYGWIGACVQYFDKYISDVPHVARNLSKNQDTKTRVGLYVRSSAITSKFDHHEKALLQFCKEKGWNNIVIYRDRNGESIDPEALKELQSLGKSGSVNDDMYKSLFQLLSVRDTLNGREQLLRDLEAGKLDVVVIYDFGRLGTNKFDSFGVLQQITKGNAKLFILGLGEVKDDTEVAPPGLDYD